MGGRPQLCHSLCHLLSAAHADTGWSLQTSLCMLETCPRALSKSAVLHASTGETLTGEGLHLAAVAGSLNSRQTSVGIAQRAPCLRAPAGWRQVLACTGASRRASHLSWVLPDLSPAAWPPPELPGPPVAAVLGLPSRQQTALGSALPVPPEALAGQACTALADFFTDSSMLHVSLYLQPLRLCRHDQSCPIRAGFVP